MLELEPQEHASSGCMPFCILGQLLLCITRVGYEQCFLWLLHALIPVVLFAPGLKWIFKSSTVALELSFPP